MKKLILATLLLLLSCKLGPNFDSLNLQINKDLAKKSSYNNWSNIDEVAVMDPWWLSIDDELFEDMVLELLENNYSFKEASARIIQAKQNYNIARSNFWPSLNSTSSASRNITPVNSLGFFDGPGKIYNNIYDVGLDVSWQLDFFGKIRRQTERDRNNFKASLEDLESLKHSLVADLFKSKIAITLYKNLEEIAYENLLDKKDIYELVKRRYNYGASGFDLAALNEAKSNLKKAEIEISTYEAALDAEINLYESLLGFLPGELDINLDDFVMIDLPQEILSCAPASLIDRRPDLRAAKYRLLAANADIGVAVADLYPDFTISASTGFSSNESTNLLEVAQLASSLSGNVATKIFQGGALKANVKAKKARLEELSANYANLIINAVREVENNLKNEVELAKQFNDSFDSKELLRKNSEFRKSRFESGIESLQGYLSVNESYYNARRDYLFKWQESWNNRVNLYLSLGGDWFNWSNANSCEVL